MRTVSPPKAARYPVQFHPYHQPLALILAVLLAASAGFGHAETLPVSIRVLGAVTGQQATRTYGGMTVARRAADLGFKHAGEIAAVSRDWGDGVAAGEVLASLKSAAFDASLANSGAEVQLASANLEATRAEMDMSIKTQRRLQDLKARGHVSQQMLDEANAALRSRAAQHAVAEAALQRARALRQSARVALEESRIIAPFAGVIQSRYLDPGAQVSPGQPVLRLIETGGMEARIGIPEAIGPTLNRSQTYTVLWQQEAVSASLIAVLPEIDPTTRTLTAVFELSPSRVPVGAVVTLKLPYDLDVAGYWVPLAALGEADRGLWSVYVAGPDDTAERRLVEVLHTEASEALVRGTLEAGDRLITSAANRVVPGQKVDVINTPGAP